MCSKKYDVFACVVVVAHCVVGTQLKKKNNNKITQHKEEAQRRHHLQGKRVRKQPGKTLKLARNTNRAKGQHEKQEPTNKHKNARQREQNNGHRSVHLIPPATVSCTDGVLHAGRNSLHTVHSLSSRNSCSNTQHCELQVSWSNQCARLQLISPQSKLA
jgi:hypothetical protein